MSTLTSREALLTSMVIQGTKPPIKSLATTGLDVEVLQQIVRSLIPRLDYMRGYQSLSVCTGLSTEAITQLDPTILDRHNQVLGVGQWQVGQRRGPGEYVGTITVMLSRRKPWIVYSESFSDPSQRSLQRVNRTDEIADAIRDVAHSIGDYVITAFRTPCESVALELAFSLMQLFNDSLRKKAEDIKNESDTLVEIQDLLDRFV